MTLTSSQSVENTPSSEPIGAEHEITAAPTPGDRGGVEFALRAAGARIAPLWPLDHFVAVNPYFGLADQRFEEAADRLARVAGIASTPSIDALLAHVADGTITTADLRTALARSATLAALEPESFLAAAEAQRGRTPVPVPTVASVASAISGRDWVRFSIDRISLWAASYFDAGQAMWKATDREARPFAAWKQEAAIDRTPEVMGLKGFRATVRDLPDDAVEAAAVVLDRLGVEPAGAEEYLHALLLRVGGWAAHASRIGFEAQLAGEEDDTIVQLLAVLLAWELGIHDAARRSDVAVVWAEARAAAQAGTDLLDPAVTHAAVLQDAFDLSEQRRLIERFAAAAPGAPIATDRPRAQAVFCIDVRSEVMRRHLEATAGDIATIGFAGFFGVPIDIVPIAHDDTEAQCPVLLTPGYHVAEVAGDAARTAEAVEARGLAHSVRRSWKSFKMGAISCFSFVGPVGLAYLPKLFTDGLGRTRPVARPETEGLPRHLAETLGPTLAPATDVAAGISLADRIAIAEGALMGMSLTDGFAPLVLLVGHGATTVNNPYDTGLDCGACGGHTGEANSRVAAAILNDAEVRAALGAKGLAIPADTWFVAAQHDTTTDVISCFDAGSVPASHGEALVALERDLDEAGRQVRRERATRLGLGARTDAEIDAAVIDRSADWAQVRPEWGLAGCRAFIAAPRARTSTVDLGGRAFLHSYDWRQDPEFSVLQLVMTAPMVVASWINLQYYASTVDNEHFGSGNKTLHNVVSRIGVLEGTSGDLRVGLPWQSVHDGEALQHDPLRLMVVIEAPLEAMTAVIAGHEHVRHLCDNGWVHLHAMGADGTVTHRYAGDLTWEPIPALSAAQPGRD